MAEKKLSPAERFLKRLAAWCWRHRDCRYTNMYSAGEGIYCVCHNAEIIIPEAYRRRG